MRMRRIFLDASVFIALLKPKDFSSDVMTSIRTLISQVDQGEVFIVSSSLMLTELLDVSVASLVSRMDGRKGVFVDVDRAVATQAREIRGKIVRKKPDGFKALDVPDCVYLATAIIYECDALVTTDGLGAHQRHTILNAAEEIAREYKLKVLSPVDAVDQRAFPFDHDA